MTEQVTRTTDALSTLWAGGGQMGARMRALDWTRTRFGPPETWPQSLRSAVSICLHSRYPIAIYWGPELLLLYNDAWSPILGEKHPWALGRAGQEVWPEIWDRIAPLFERVTARSEGVWQEDELLPMHRHGYTEECYFNFTFSPILDETGRVGGVFNAVVETTDRVIDERRMRLLRHLAERTSGAKSIGEVWTAGAEALAAAPADIPFALLYSLGADGTVAQLEAAVGLGRDAPASPRRVRLDRAADGACRWPLAEAARSGGAVRVDDLVERFGALPAGPWPEPPVTALVLPVAGGDQGRPAGILVAGASPRRALDDRYRAFLERVAERLGTAVVNARSYEAERRRAEMLAQLDRAKTAFFSNVSHEFRTPLTLLLAPVEDVLTDLSAPLARQHRERLELAHRNGLRLLRLVNMLLDFARIEAGRIDAVYEPTDLAAATAELASTFASAIERAGLQLVVDAPPLPEPVYVDREMWEKIVLNLLSNAFKFTHAGSITVALRWAGDHVELAVTDTGIGIPAEELPRLFERFHRVKGAQGRTQEGTGIGLALVHELVRLHGGRLEVTSREGVGTTFTVHIPTGSAHLPAERIGTTRTLASTGLGAAPFVEEARRWLDGGVSEASPGTTELLGAADATAQVPARGRDGGVPRVLVADDNADMREYVARLLATRWRVAAVADGQAALEAALADPPDLVLADVMMPRLDGFGLLRALREDPRTSAIPILLLSARAGEEASVEGLASGADDYLIKPFTARELIARVGAHLSVAQTRREALAREAEARAEAERAIARLNFALEVNRIVAFERDLETGFTEYSQSAQSVLGIPGGRSRDRADLVHPEDRQRVQDILDRGVATQPIVEVEFRIIRPDTGAVRWLRLVGQVTRDETGKAVRLTGVARDITEKRSAEQQAQAAQRLDAVGQLAGGVAHEVNNALTGTLGFAHLALRRLEPDDPVRSDIEQIIRSGERAAGVAKQLLAYSRRQLLQPRRFDLATMVRGFEPLLRQTLGPDKELVLDLPTPAWVHADQAQLEQVLLNLALNARDAMSYGGRATVSVRVERIAPGSAHGRTPAGEVPAGTFAIMRVSDTGTGMDEATLARLFEPFFTTKPVGQGTGLGLATAYGIVRQSGGHIWVESELGRGTTVHVALPLLETAVPDGPAQAPEPPPRGTRKERVLVVDDEPVVLEVLHRVLDEAGYTAQVARSGAAALELIRQTNGAFDVVLTDLVMPGMSGRELAQAIAMHHPEVRIVFMSGYSNDEGVRRGLLTEGATFIPKPLDLNRVLTVVREVLNDAPARARD